MHFGSVQITVPNQHCLAVALQKLYGALPEGTVQFSHAFSGFSQDPDSVRLQFPGQPDVQARFLVAADGYFSPIRQEVLADGPPQFAVSNGIAQPQ